MNNIIIETKYKEILKGKDKLYGIKNKCETYNDLMICKEADVIDISNDLCISRIINSLNSTCNTTNDHHIPTIEKINKGVILLNKFSGKIEADKMAQEINGTHVVIFYNATITINNKEYSNIEVMPITSIPAILQPTPLEKDHIEILSLESLKDLHINNTHRINSLKKATLSIGGLISITSVITIALFILLKKKSIKIQYIEKEVSKPKAGSPPQESNDIPTYVKFNDLPFY